MTASDRDREAFESWETFCDESFFDMWSVRPTGARAFSDAFHLPSKAEALRAIQLSVAAHAREAGAQEPVAAGWVAGAEATREAIAKAFEASAPKLSGPDYGLAAPERRQAMDEEARRAWKDAKFIRAFPLPTPPAGEG